MRQLSTTFIAIVSAVALAQVASAADLPRKAPAFVPPAPVYAWTGPYIGASVGWIGSYNRVTDVDGFQDAVGTEHTYDRSGVTGGLYVGYNWQMTNWLLGVEADASGASVKSSHVLDDTPGSGFDMDAIAESKVYWTSTFRGRVGYLVTPSLLFYGTGGLALAGIKNSVSDFDAGVFDPTDSVSRTSTRIGWAAGGGIEYMFTPNVIGRVEGLYMDFDDKTLTTPNGDRYRFRNKVATARAGVAWKW